MVDLFSWFSSVSTPLLQPLREVILNEFDLAGRYAAVEIGRGYGLGSNFITDSFFLWILVFISNFIFYDGNIL